MEDKGLTEANLPAFLELIQNTQVEGLQILDFNSLRVSGPKGKDC